MSSAAPTIIVADLNGKPRSYRVQREPLRIGRAETCQIVLRDDAEVSRVHAEVHLDEEGYVVVTDLGAKNGTRVDGGEVFRSGSRIAVRSIRIGEHELRLQSARAPESHRADVHFAEDELPADPNNTQFFPSTRGLDLNKQRLEKLIQLTERIGGVFERKQLLEEALDACCDALRFERGLIALKTQRGDTELPISRNVERDENGAFKISRTLINKALMHGERTIVNNPEFDLPANLTDSMVRYPIRSALCVPILHRNEILGVIYGDRITQESHYLPQDVDFLFAIAQQVGVGIANLRLFQQQLRTQRLYVELDQARNIQTRLLPDRPFVRGRMRIAGYNEPSSTVSGDYFDYFELDHSRAGIIIADVAGHGLPAALIMANFQAAVRVALSADVPLPELADRLNKLIYRNTSSNVFVTAIVGVVQSDSGTIDYVGAGHHGPLLFEGDRVETMDDLNSLPFGIELDERYEVMRIEPSERLRAALFYTDGLLEAADPDGRILGCDALRQRLAAVRDYSPQTLIDTALEIVREHVGGTEPADDMTLLALQYS